MEPLKPALIIAAHGSKSPGWADSVHELVRHVAESPGVRDMFSTVTAGFLEASLPALADAVEVPLKAGAAEAIVVPLLLTASAHQTQDVPALLGLEVPAHIRQRLVAEGQRVLLPGWPIRVVSLGEVSEILHRNVIRRMALEVRDPSREAVVLVGYGSSIFYDEWEKLMHDVRLCLIRDGYGGVAHAYCGHVAQLSPEPTYNAIVQASQQAGVKRVHVMPLLMSHSELQTGPIAAACQAAHPKLTKHHVQLRYTSDAILPDGDLAARIAFVALEALGVMAPMLGGANGGTA